MSKEKNEFDEKAGTWDNQPERVQRSRVVAEAISKQIPVDPTLTAMEYGCGTGLLSFHLQDRFSRIVLIDSSQGMLSVVREKIKRDNIQNMDVLNIDLLESEADISTPFSVIYNIMVLHHIDDVSKILSIWYKLLKKTGYLCIADLDSDNGLFHGENFRGHNGFDRKELETQAIEAGFTDISFTTPYRIEKLARDSVCRSFPVFLMTARKMI